MRSSERRFSGVAGADGVAVGPVHLLADLDVPVGGVGGPDEQARALAALQALAAQLGDASARLRATGRTDEAAILETSALMAEDPSLLAEVEALAATRPAPAALLQAAEQQAALLAAIPDPYLAARAADVLRLGRQAARALTPRPPLPRAGEGGGGEVLLVARDLGPADLAEIELAGLTLAGIALAEGSVTSHAAIVARSLGVPLVVGLGERILTLIDGEVVVLDGTVGTLVMAPRVETVRRAQATVERQTRRRARLARDREAGAVTTDGHRIRLLVNASTEREALAGLAAGADGIGLLRTELAFLEATRWPDDAQHEATLSPVLRHLSGRTATVRTLDFGADKTPPFLRGRPERGIALQLTDAADALSPQLRALLRAGADTRLRIMLPLVEAPEQVAAARDALRAAHRATPPDAPVPPLGAMIETARAVERIDAIAAVSDFLSIGTNDLVQALLGLDRLTPAATVRAAADPRVLHAIRTVTTAARQRGLTVEVCGEAAGDPRIAVLLLGLGVSELSVAPARLDEVRAAVRAVTLARAAKLAEAALGQTSAEAALALLDTELAGLSSDEE